MAAAIAAADGGVNVVMVAVGRATGSDSAAVWVPISKSAAMAAATVDALGGVKVMTVAAGRETARTFAVMHASTAASETFSAPAALTVAKYEALDGSARTTVSRRTLFGPTNRLTASRSNPVPGVTAIVAVVGKGISTYGAGSLVQTGLPRATRFASARASSFRSRTRNATLCGATGSVERMPVKTRAVAIAPAI